MKCSSLTPGPGCAACAAQTGEIVKRLIAAFRRRITPEQAASLAEELELIGEQVAEECPLPGPASVILQLQSPRQPTSE